MGIKASLCKATAVGLALFLALPAVAGVPPLEPLNHKLRFDVTWNGITIGRIRVKIAEDTFRYSMSVDTKTSGIARLFSEEKSVATAEGRLAGGTYVHSAYHSRNDNGSRQRTNIRYDEKGDIITQERLPPNRGKSRALVPLEDANTATDPVSSFFILRKMLHTAMGENVRDVSVKSYDGVRLGELKLHVVSPARVKVMDTWRDAVNVVISRQPVNGYSKKELKKFEEGDPVIHIYFSADGKFMPLKAQLQSGFGTIAATLVELH